ERRTTGSGRSSMSDSMKSFIEYVARSLVDNPDAVQVTVKPGDQADVIELTVAKDDLGKIIGRQGRTAKAIRTVLSGISVREKRRAVLEILE
ncbi:MAG: KH domain-containing protein, partial [Desulfovibrio sp.]|nr:KH domain-containing protein [Desulfovibrio sp.]